MKKLFIILCLLLLCFIPANAGVITVVNNSSMAVTAGNPTEILRATGVGAANAWTYSTTGLYQDSSDSDNGTYIQCIVYDDALYLDLANTSASAGKTIVKITFHAIARNTANSNIPRFLIYSAGTYLVNFSAITGTFVEYTNEWALNPNTSAAWTSTNINNLSIGFKTYAGANTTQIAEAWIEVEYEE
jgi:hypothetical protein